MNERRKAQWLSADIHACRSDFSLEYKEREGRSVCGFLLMDVCLRNNETGQVWDRWQAYRKEPGAEWFAWCGDLLFDAGEWESVDHRKLARINHTRRIP